MRCWHPANHQESIDAVEIELGIARGNAEQVGETIRESDGIAAPRKIGPPDTQLVATDDDRSASPVKNCKAEGTIHTRQRLSVLFGIEIRQGLSGCGSAAARQ